MLVSMVTDQQISNKDMILFLRFKQVTKFTVLLSYIIILTFPTTETILCL